MTTTLFRAGERRRHPRHRAWEPLVLALPGDDKDMPGTLLDISASGALIRIEPGQRPPRMVALRLRLAGSEQLFRATVLTTEPAWNGSLMHVRFEGLSREESASLAGLLASREERTAARHPAGLAHVLAFERR
jgi:hypothetical protein